MFLLILLIMRAADDFQGVHFPPEHPQTDISKYYVFEGQDIYPVEEIGPEPGFSWDFLESPGPGVWRFLRFWERPIRDMKSWDPTPRIAIDI